jgi:serine/threonine protein kinase
VNFYVAWQINTRKIFLSVCKNWIKNSTRMERLYTVLKLKISSICWYPLICDNDKILIDFTQWKKIQKFCSIRDFTFAFLIHFLQEIKFMKGLRFHPHLVCMLGYVSDSVSPLLVLELCANGDLLKFLRKNKDKFVDVSSCDNVKFSDRSKNFCVF